jgi:hypothetical protein
MSAEDVIEEINFIEKALGQLESDNVIEIQAVFDAAVEKGIVKPQEYNTRKEEIFSNEALQEQVAELAEKFVDVEDSDAQNAASDVVVLGPILTERLDVLKTYDERKGMAGIPEYIGTKPYEDYTKAVEELDKKYDALIADAENKVAEDIKSEVEANRPEAMKKTIKQLRDLIDTKEDIVQTKRNYIVDGDLHDRMSNRIKTGYDTYGYTGESDLVDVYDSTIGAALEGKTTTDDTTDQEAEILKRLEEISITQEEITDLMTYDSGNGKILEQAQRLIDNYNRIFNVKAKITGFEKSKLKIQIGNYKTDITAEALVLGGSGEIFTIDKEGIEELINAKYAAELDALKQPATPGVLTQNVIDDFIKELVDADLPGVNTNRFTVDIVRDELETLIAPEGTRLTKKTQKQIDSLNSQLADVESKLDSVKDK